MTTTIALNKLLPSPRNVRRASDPEADRQLRADIEARGLLQNLVVSPVRKPKGCFAVEAGQRRLSALQALAAENKIALDAGVECLIVEGDQASLQEASLAENVQRLRMNPADECLAFQQLLEKGSDVEGIARRFGLTTRFVEGRLRLAGLTPAVFDALGSGDISLDVAKAYAVTSDRERQQQVFDQVHGSYCGNHPDSIRRLITQATVRAGDRRALFVGEEAYLEAGGRIERDLFASDGEARWLDPALLEQLAADRLAAKAEKVRAERGLAFVVPTLESWVGAAVTEGLQRLRLPPAPMTAEEEQQLERLEAEYDELACRLEDEELTDEERDASERRAADIEDAVRALRARPPLLEDDLRVRAGTFMLLDERGQPRLDGSYYLPADDPVASADDRGRGETSAVAESELAKATPKSGLSQRLLDELAMQRRDILAVHVAADPAFALDLAIFLLADRASGSRYVAAGSTLSASLPNDPVSAAEAPATAAAKVRSEATDQLDHGWTRADSVAERFDAFRALPEEARGAWLGHVVARSLEAVPTAGGQASFHDHLGELLQIDVASWWRPTGGNFFDRVPKAMSLAALQEIGGAAFAERYAKARKSEIAQSCERIFAGDFIGEAEVKTAALNWLPQAMRFHQALSMEAGAAGMIEMSMDESIVADEVGAECDQQSHQQAA